jgi:iron complex transport system permease protein
LRGIKSRKFTLTLFFSLIPMMVLATLVGPVFISPAKFVESLLSILSLMDIGSNTSNQTSISHEEVILSAIRFPRVVLAALVGACLACCGAVMQGLFRNPLADPSLIGVSSGASAGASFVIVFCGTWLHSSSFFGLTLVAFGASIGGALAVLLVYRLSTSSTGTSVPTMLLVGIAISALAGALNGIFSFVADNEMLRRMSLWQMGSLDAANWFRVGIAGIAASILLITLPNQSQALNAFLLGESEARHLGIDTERVKQRIILLTAIGVGTSVAVAGMISFVGLVVPHMVRLVIGPDHRYLIPSSAALGAILLIAADSFARIIVAPAELPTGILTALLGVPFFFWLLTKNHHRIQR